MALKEAHRNKAPQLPRREFLKWLGEVTVVTAGIVGVGGVAVVKISQLFKGNGENNDSAVTIVRDTAPTAAPAAGEDMQKTDVATPVAIATPDATKVATPEAPKVVFWTADQIRQAQQDALAQGKVLLLDTWSDRGGVPKEAKSYRDNPVLIIDNLGKQTLNSPVVGQVKGISIGVGNNGPDMRFLYIQFGNRVIQFAVDISNTILVTSGQKVDINTPLVDLSGRMLAASLLLSQTGQVEINDDTVLSSAINTLVDSTTNLPVRLAPQK